MLQNDQIGFVFSVVSLLSFVSLFLTSPSLIQRKIIYSIRIVKNRGNIRSFLQNSYLAIYWISFLTINTSQPKPQASGSTVMVSGKGVECLLLFVSYTFSDSKLSSETTFPFNHGLDINVEQISII